jgi:hypothetical protein
MPPMRISEAAIEVTAIPLKISMTPMGVCEAPIETAWCR